MIWCTLPQKLYFTHGGQLCSQTFIKCISCFQMCGFILGLSIIFLWSVHLIFYFCFVLFCFCLSFVFVFWFFFSFWPEFCYFHYLNFAINVEIKFRKASALLFLLENYFGLFYNYLCILLWLCYLCKICYWNFDRHCIETRSLWVMWTI